MQVDAGLSTAAGCAAIVQLSGFRFISQRKSVFARQVFQLICGRSRYSLDGHTAMLVTLYRLRSLGKPRSYRAVVDAPRPHGSLVFGAGNGPARVAELLGGGRVQARLLHAEMVRVSNGCLLLQGQEDGHDQTWLCGQDERAGEAALRKIRPPTAADMPFAGFQEEDDDLLD